MPPTLSVLITYHNERELLGVCLRSLAAQSPPPHEILIYDDASTYPATDYIPAGIGVRLIRGEINIRPARGRNLLLREARCDYVHFHDADDAFLPDWSDCVHATIAATGADLVLTEISSYSQDQLVCEHVLDLGRLWKEEDPLDYALRGSVITSAGVCLRAAASAVGGFRETMRQSEDYDFYVRLLASGLRVAIIAKPLVRRENRADSYSAREWAVVCTSIVEALERFAGELPSRYQPLLAERAAGAGSTLYKLGYYGAAREAFALARRLGPPTFEGQRLPYRLLAHTLGPEVAERISLLYRKALPEQFRRIVALRDWYRP